MSTGGFLHSNSLTKAYDTILTLLWGALATTGGVSVTQTHNIQYTDSCFSLLTRSKRLASHLAWDSPGLLLSHRHFPLPQLKPLSSQKNSRNGSGRASQVARLATPSPSYFVFLRSEKLVFSVHYPTPGTFFLSHF